jgi:outer membrane protein OmpA-like peptidoglycan-associated protein
MKNILIAALSSSFLASCISFDTFTKATTPVTFYSRYAVNDSIEVDQAISDGISIQVVFKSLATSEPTFFDKDSRLISWIGSGNIARFPYQNGDVTVKTKIGYFTISKFASASKIEVLPIPTPIIQESPKYTQSTIPPFEQSVAQFEEISQHEAPSADLKLDRSLDSLKYAIYFEYASANLNPTGKAAIEALQSEAKLAEKINVVGRADPSGNASKNTKLAIARAQSVRGELVKYGVPAKAININSYVALSKSDGRIALKQNLPLELSAASRRADLDMLVKPVVPKLAAHSNFVAIPG